VVVHPSNTWAESLTVDELRRIWEPGSKINNWSQVRAGFPNKKLTLYGPGIDSGTFDYFTKAVVGKEKSSRSDYNSSEDDNTLVTGVAGDEGALGYFGYAYLEQNRDKLKAVKIDGDQGPIEPTPDTIGSGEYQPLSRPLLIYVNRKSLDRPEVEAFVRFALTEGRNVLGRVGYVPLTDRSYELALERLQRRTTGSVFGGTLTPGVKLEDLLSDQNRTP
ncbi:MAG TPA: substrate-binding domain-containing protein, partial [Fimbriimonadaceae bacterium]|nr:substrate-binding domain-containing protein [Fimbriimonadaceae bacterium]